MPCFNDLPQPGLSHSGPQRCMCILYYHVDSFGYPQPSHHHILRDIHLPVNLKHNFIKWTYIQIPRLNITSKIINFMTSMVCKGELLFFNKFGEMNDTLKHITRSPTFSLSHSEGSKGIERSRIPLLTLTHSSSSLPKPANLTRTSCITK